MTQFKLDLHIHTERSPDSRMTLTQAAAAAKQRGVDALAVCDHNRCASGGVFAHPVRGGVLLIPGVEYSTECGHLLGLFLQRPCICPGEETGRVRFDDAVRVVREAGGLCVLAHPFELTQRSEAEITAQIAALRDRLDGLETHNCRATKKRRNANRLAEAEAVRHGLLQTAGSDAHQPSEVGRAWVAVSAETCTVPALRAALSAPDGFSCASCKQLAFARSRLTYLKKKKSGVSAYLKWLPYAALCALRNLRGGT